MTNNDDNRMLVKCCCKEPGCNCHNQISVPKYVAKGTQIICAECLAKHAPAEAPVSTGM
jgi:hypothetical protein